MPRHVDPVDAFRELYFANRKNDRKALKLQAAEYERRLDALNHAHEAAEAAQAKTVPREVFEQYVREVDTRTQTAFDAQADKFETVTSSNRDAIENLVNWRFGIEGRIIGISAVIGFVTFVVSVAVTVAGHIFK